ncbi:MAG: hypothetical protein WAO08_15315 [Hyphomicrobiaceae bacterium]
MDRRRLPVVMAQACKKAGVTELTFHDLRGSVITAWQFQAPRCPRSPPSGGDQHGSGPRAAWSSRLRGAPTGTVTCSGLSLGDVRGVLDRHYVNNDVALAECAIRKLEGRPVR